MIDKTEIVKNICYTDRVYERINKKLKISLCRGDIEQLIEDVVKTAPEEDYIRTGKNYYVSNREKGIRVTINSRTFRVITVDPLPGDRE